MSIKSIRTASIFIEYAIQKLTKYRFDSSLEQELKQQADYYLKNEMTSAVQTLPPDRSLESLDLSDKGRFKLVRGDIHHRFEVSTNGAQKDHFGRKGTWIPRGCKLYYDNVENDYLKIFGEYFCYKGEGAFLNKAIELGLYRFLCPGLKYLLKDDSGNLRGYSIVAGRVLTHYEFERYIGISLRGVIEAETRRAGLYFYDLTRHNSIIKDRQISLIDLESILPLEWLGKGAQFSLQHLDEVDCGWVVQSKMFSPGWYREFVKECL